MNKESNSYTLIYASGMVLLVALLLAFTSEILRPQQTKNQAIDKMRQILTSLAISSTNSDAEELYNKYIVSSYVVNADGDKVSGDAFDTELVNEWEKPAGERKYPVYEANINGKTKYILALRGTGLWGPIWGFISLNEDKSTAYGASFGHEGETPGLGAEIDKPAFGKKFAGKRIFTDGKFTSIAIVKPGKIVQGQDYVDGISGGTITSQGVDAMLKSSIGIYEPFLVKP